MSILLCTLFLSLAAKDPHLPPLPSSGRLFVQPTASGASGALLAQSIDLMASSGEGGSGGGGTGSAKAIVTDQICAAIKSTSNLLHLMQQSSPSQAQLMKLPKNLVAKASVTHNTGNALKKLPQLVSSFDNHLDSGLQSVSHLKTVSQLLSNMENSQLKAISRVQQPSKADFN